MTDRKQKPPSGAKMLLALGSEAGLDLIRDQYGETWGKLPGGIISPISAGGVGAHLTRLYVNRHQEPPPKGSVAEACETLRALAVVQAVSEPVYLRFGPLPGVYTPDEWVTHFEGWDALGWDMPAGVAIDLGTDDRTAIVIRPNGWTVERHPINFRRTPAMRALPEPSKWSIRPSNLPAAMRVVLNLADEDSARLVVAFLVSVLKPSGSSLGLALSGPAGSAKTFATRILRHIFDPVGVDGGGAVRSLPKLEDAFAATATANAIPCFDNLSGMNAEQADWLSQLMTGYSKEARKLYTDGESYQRSATRPVILNGISLSDRPDLMSRLLLIEVSALTSASTEESLWETFERAHPLILGALCDVVADALANVNSLPEDGWQVRMADVARFVTAAEPTLGWEHGWFERELAEAQGQAVNEVLGQQGWYQPLLDALDQHGGELSMTPTDLLDELVGRYRHSHGGDDPSRGDFSWPKSGKGMTEALKRHHAGLRAVGVTFENPKSNGVRHLKVVRAMPETA